MYSAFLKYSEQQQQHDMLLTSNLYTKTFRQQL